MTSAAAKQLFSGRKQDCSAGKRDVGMAYEIEETLESHLQERLGLFSIVTGGMSQVDMFPLNVLETFLLARALQISKGLPQEGLRSLCLEDLSTNSELPHEEAGERHWKPSG